MGIWETTVLVEQLVICSLGRTPRCGMAEEAVPGSLGCAWSPLRQAQGSSSSVEMTRDTGGGPRFHPPSEANLSVIFRSKVE